MDFFHLIIVVALYAVFNFAEFLIKKKKKSSGGKQKPVTVLKPAKKSFQDGMRQSIAQTDGDKKQK